MKKAKWWVIGLLMAAVVYLAMRRPPSTEQLSALQRERAELRDRLAASEQTIADLEARLASLQGGHPGSGAPQAAASSNLNASATERELQRRLVEVTTLQSNAEQLVKSLVATRETPETLESVEQLEKKTRASLGVLEKQFAEAREKALAARARQKELLINMNIPSDISSMNPDQGLNSLQLQSYWPFFEARKEAEADQMVVERLRMRMMQERIEVEIIDAQEKALRQASQ